MNTGIIYGLRCPVLNEIRYVGQTMLPLDRKLYIMLNSYTRTNAGLNEWLDSLRADKRIADLQIISIEDNIPESSLNKKETYWIQHYEKFGSLTNKAMYGAVNRNSFQPKSFGTILRRYIVIDRLIRDRKPTLNDLIVAVNEAGGDVKASRRTIQLDLEEMRYSVDLGFHAPIVFTKKGMHYKYSNEEYTLFGAIEKLCFPAEQRKIDNTKAIAA